MTTLAAGLTELAEQVDGMKWRSVWPALHLIAYPVDDGYAVRVGAVFQAVRQAADCRYMGSLSAVLKAQHRDADLGRTLRAAVAHLPADAVQP